MNPDRKIHHGSTNLTIKHVKEVEKFMTELIKSLARDIFRKRRNLVSIRMSGF